MAKGKRKNKKGHVHRHRVTRHDQMKIRASKALDILAARAQVEINKWKRRTIVLGILLVLSIAVGMYAIFAAKVAL